MAWYDQILAFFQDKTSKIENAVQDTASLFQTAISQKQELPQEMEDQAEAISLYAEYAIDFATQTMRHALIAALTAVILQRRAETNPNENGEKGESL